MNREKILSVYKRYKQNINMSYSELKKWSKNPCSKKASIGRTAINRNLKLLRKPVSKLDEKDAQESLKTISFNSRMKKVPAGERVDGCNLSKRSISLMNWGFDPNK